MVDNDKRRRTTANSVGQLRTTIEASLFGYRTLPSYWYLIQDTLLPDQFPNLFPRSKAFSFIFFTLVAHADLDQRGLDPYIIEKG
ncbi:uncharacterized protein HKW66_Vig0074810 [Vigna angularis]|uniref:Uncharacterized protein n=1 Tax=Phaseolus angularis TaxID=3914 RepID=A0A8T0K9C1_PHAAN|nr:uncharacterized protein HKW66_Vig0074810 [Vigna angularis]